MVSIYELIASEIMQGQGMPLASHRGREGGYGYSPLSDHDGDCLGQAGRLLRDNRRFSSLFSSNSPNPSLKWTYMEKTWEDKKEWIERAKARVEQLWKETYKSTPSFPILRQDSVPALAARRPNG
jgi:hypothetical protein